MKGVYWESKVEDQKNVHKIDLGDTQIQKSEEGGINNDAQNTEWVKKEK